MRTKTLLSLLLLTGSTAAVAGIGTMQTTPPLQNELVNEGVPAPDDTTAPETASNSTDIDPSAEPADNAAEPNATTY